MATIAIDVDITTVRDMGQYWLNWLNKESKTRTLTLEDCMYSYDLGKWFPDVKDPHEYWRSPNLYDDITPSRDALDIVTWLTKEHEVVFVSTVKGQHHKSKYNMLRRWFPRMKGFIATKEKQYVKCDVIIDDRNDILNKISYDTIKIKMDSPFTQLEKLNPVSSLVAKDWYDVEDIIGRLDI